MKITKNDVSVETMRSGGPGGQHADRRETGVRLRINLDQIEANDDEKAFLREYIPPKNITESGEILVENTESRSRSENTKRGMNILKQTIEEAIEEGRQELKDQKRSKRISKGKTGGGGSGGSERDRHEKQKRRRRSKNTDDFIEQAYDQNPELMEDYVLDIFPDESE